MIRHILAAILGLSLLASPGTSAAGESPVATWSADGTKLTISGSCDADANILSVILFDYNGGPSYAVDCADTGQGGRFSVTFPSPPDYPDSVPPGSTVFVEDWHTPLVTLTVPPAPGGSVAVPALGEPVLAMAMMGMLLLVGWQVTRRRRTPGPT